MLNAAMSTAQDGGLVLITDVVNQVVDTLNDSFDGHYTHSDAMVTPASNLKFGDYQCNAAMKLAKPLKMKPRDVASILVTELNAKMAGEFEELEIAGPGFINMKLQRSYLERAVQTMAADSERLGIPKSPNPKKIVVDFSSPNIAKEMHVGHLRSTIIGDTLANLLTFKGHSVLRLNHVGDWGTQFGMLVEHLKDEFPAALTGDENVDLGNLVILYKAAKKRFDDDDDFKVRAREGVVRLQSGDEESLAAWRCLCATSRKEYAKIYDLLSIENLEERGESFYNDMLKGVVEDLEEQGLAKKSEGAMAVFLDGYANKDGTPLPLLVKKSDGGFNYATTDLAAITQRTQQEKADRVLYVTDSGQAQHFKMVFEAAKLAGMLNDGVSLEHVPFGLVQGEDGKKFATRSGDTVKLMDLLQESIRIATNDVGGREVEGWQDGQELPEEFKRTAKIVGISAVKYADLSMNRESNYKFSYGRMLSLQGNTAPYMLYARARICSIVKKASGLEGVAEGSMIWPEPAPVLLGEETEIELARQLAKFGDVLYDVEEELYPNRLCDYLFETSQKFSAFYERCEVTRSEATMRERNISVRNEAS
ncbi:hypothetical protein TL16_g03834 [Triparma laevis f. inornata]|uniref:arginine--tRNA ligase n=1 Tax=Triparma laevis f. inornata TaxID=1714386 RepID=A0A9W7A1E7_9STRA|nr:hypothetical protein TL16_g03834 [Triparma laevis f. inornata]